VSHREVEVDAVATLAFAIADEHEPFRSAWHAHGKHQLLYAARGTMVLRIEDRHWILPPQRAAWISAGTSHQAESKTGIALRTVYFAPRVFTSMFRSSTAPSLPLDGCRVFAVKPLAREMILHAMRWGPEAAVSQDPTRHAFFCALAALAVEWIAEEKAYYLPEPKTRELARAMNYIGDHLAEATVEGAAAAAHVSVRTLARRFEDETGVSFRSYVQSARMMRALELLCEPRTSVSATAFAVGFRSVGAFTSAFREWSGETPTEYRARLRG
jgi:AraC-like DNA-binding protein